MVCERCRGLMVAAYLIEDGAILPCLNCLNCGNYLDKTIQRHHQLYPSPSPSQAQTTAFSSEPPRRSTCSRTELFSASEKPCLPRPDRVVF